MGQIRRLSGLDRACGPPVDYHWSIAFAFDQISSDFQDIKSQNNVTKDLWTVVKTNCRLFKQALMEDTVSNDFFFLLVKDRLKVKLYDVMW